MSTDRRFGSSIVSNALNASWRASCESFDQSFRNVSYRSGGQISASSAPACSSLRTARSVRFVPGPVAGQVAHQFTTAVDNPFSAATSQNVLTLRSEPLAIAGRASWSRSVAAATAVAVREPPGASAPSRPVTRRSSSAEIPCRSGGTPVAIVVQTRAGSVSRAPGAYATAVAISEWMTDPIRRFVGIPIRSGSKPSTPTTTTR